MAHQEMQNSKRWQTTSWDTVSILIYCKCSHSREYRRTKTYYQDQRSINLIATGIFETCRIMTSLIASSQLIIYTNFSKWYLLFYSGLWYDIFLTWVVLSDEATNRFLCKFLSIILLIQLKYNNSYQSAKFSAMWQNRKMTRDRNLLISYNFLSYLLM